MIPITLLPPPTEQPAEGSIALLHHARYGYYVGHFVHATHGVRTERVHALSALTARNRKAEMKEVPWTLPAHWTLVCSSADLGSIDFGDPELTGWQPLAATPTIATPEPTPLTGPTFNLLGD